MNDLDAVTFGESRAPPVGAADDRAIELDSEAFGREREVLYEIAESHSLRHVTLFAINLNTQRLYLLLQALLMMRRRSASSPSAAARTRITARPEVKNGIVAHTKAMPF
jgi:hypothetical protein